MALENWNWRGEGTAEEAEGEIVGGIMVFTPAESKRLIARAVARMPQVRTAVERGRVVIAAGSTDAYVAEEILGRQVPREYYLKGNISSGMMCATSRSDLWIKPFVLVEGSLVDRSAEEVLKEFDARDVFIKGANAVDPLGHAGILMASASGGTIGGALGTVVARGAHLVVPVGLEKLIPSVIEASRRCGIKKLRYPDGATVGLMPLVTATVVTEIQALRLLAGVEATHVSSGGIGGSEGSVVLVVEGPDARVRAAFELWEQIKGEAAIPVSPIQMRYGIDGRSGSR